MTEGEEMVMSGHGEEEAEFMEEEKGVERNMVRWERFLPRMSVRVLLVEADDSTRQIIAALLRKCSYKVVAASDGLKAWETLKERPHTIDLVLTEVELPSISGFSLLSMIMEHESCKKIPVIMMSSHDSISTVFKCMLKGAADFLVKPIRKNELRNLWQHVWRRYSSSGEPGGIHGHQDENLVEQSRKSEANSETNASNHSSNYAASMQINKECSEKGSDAQSSCTRADMEAESTYMQNLQESKQLSCKGSSFMDDTIAQKAEEHIQLDSASQMHEGKAEDKSIMLGSEVTPRDEACNSNELILEEGHACAVATTMDEDVTPPGCMEHTYVTDETNRSQGTLSREVINLIEAIDNQPRSSYAQRGSPPVQNGLSKSAEVLTHEKDRKWKSSSIPLLELSLSRHQPSSCDEQENHDLNTIKHSNSSAFSLYNSRTVIPTLVTSANFKTEHKDCSSISTKSLPYQGSGIPVNSLECNGGTRNMDLEDARTHSFSFSSEDGMAGQCSHPGILPYPVRGINFESLRDGYGLVMQPIFYPQSGQPMWNPNPTMLQEAVHTNSSHNSAPKDPNSEQSHHPDDRSVKMQIYHSEKNKEQNLEQVEDHIHVSSVTGDSGSSSICNSSRSFLNHSGYGSVCDGSSGNISAANVSKATAQSGTDGDLFAHGNKPTDCLNPREAALTKFRLKRKDRCFEKKVRYQSRKKLAEQRPRVKGQFVRQVQPDP